MPPAPVSDSRNGAAFQRHTRSINMLRIISALLLAATMVAATADDGPALVANPPERHIVVSGDTLWGISGKFLQQPWRWPEIWRMNREQIANPHRIYPGDVVVLDLSRGQPQLKLAKPLGTARLQPQVHSEKLPVSIPSIPPNVIEPFISRPLIIEAGELDKVPRILAAEENRVLIAAGDLAFIKGMQRDDIEKWQVFRPGKPLKDPETGQIVAHEAFFLGDARLIQAGEPAVVRIVRAKEEITRGDRLLPTPPQEMITYAPHRPETEITARVMSIYGGLNEAAAGSVISLNRGERDGLEVGHVLALFRKRNAADHDSDGRRTSTTLPEQRYALVFVFRIFERVAYALVMESSRSVIVGDAARNP